MLLLVIVLGVSHGLFLLPVLLTLFGPGSCGHQEKTKDQIANMNNNNNNTCEANQLKAKTPIYRPRLQSPISVHNLLESPTRKELRKDFSARARTENQWLIDQGGDKNELRKMSSQISFTEPSDSPNCEESLVSHVSSCHSTLYSSRYLERNNTRRMSTMVRGTPPVVNNFRPRAMSLIQENTEETMRDSSEMEVRRYSTTKNNNFTSIQYYINKHQTAFNNSALSRINHDSGVEVESSAQPTLSQFEDPAVETTQFTQNNVTGIDNPVFDNEEESDQNTSTPHRKTQALSVYNSEEVATITHRKAALERLQAFETDKMGLGFDI
jgi:hypothetical protein